jgi:hypothetical protein
MLTAVDTVDGVPRDHEAELRSDYAAYRSHVYRVLISGTSMAEEAKVTTLMTGEN